VTLCVHSGEVAGIFHSGAEAGWTHHGAVPASKAARRDLLPLWTIEIPLENAINGFDIYAACLFTRRRFDRQVRFLNYLGSCGRGFEFREQLRTALAACLNQEFMGAFAGNFGERQVKPAFRVWARTQRSAETRSGRMRALRYKQKRALAAGGVDRVMVLVASQHAILQCDGCEVARANTEEGEWVLRRCSVVQNSKRALLTFGRPKLHVSRMKVSLASLRSDSEAKKNRALLPLEPIVSRGLLVCPTGR
jgi:hypothetical protein